MKVLFLVSNPERLSGSNRSLLEVIKRLPEEVDIEVLAFGEGFFVDFCRKHKIKIFVFPLPYFFTTEEAKFLQLSWTKLPILFFGFVKVFVKTLVLFIKNRPDVIHANDHRALFLIGPAALLFRLPIVVHARGASPFRKIANPKLRNLVMWAYKMLTSRIIAVSTDTANSLAPLNCIKQIRIVRNGVGELKETEGRQYLSPWLSELKASGSVVICAFASLVPAKGIHHLVDAIAELEGSKDLGEKFVCLVVGDFVPEFFEYQRWLIDKIREAGIRSLTLVGYQENPFPFFAQTDIVVLPAVDEEILEIYGRRQLVVGTEGLSRAILEAMSFGLPVVAANVAGVNEQVVDKETGFIVPQGRGDLLANRLATLIKDEHLRRFFGRAGKERADLEFSTSKSVEGVMKVYGELHAAAH